MQLAGHELGSLSDHRATVERMFWGKLEFLGLNDLNDLYSGHPFAKKYQCSSVQLICISFVSLDRQAIWSTGVGSELLYKKDQMLC